MASIIQWVARWILVLTCLPLLLAVLALAWIIDMSDAKEMLATAKNALTFPKR
jgi:hypothetical protein